MPRIARKISASSLYHVISRGSGKQIIFETDEDRTFFMRKLDNLLLEHNGSLLAWCLMDNHFHLFIDIPHDELQKLMHRLLTSYAGYFNRVHNRVGSLFGGRYKSETVEDEAYLIELVRYIHENPIKAGMTQELDYQWSSYSEYVGKPFHIDPSLVLGVFEGIDHFRNYHEESHCKPHCMDYQESTFRHSDKDALKIAEELLGKGVVESIKSLDRDSRDNALAQLRQAGLGVRQIQRLTGISLTTISRATSSSC